jgi:hypothetical protein
MLLIERGADRQSHRFARHSACYKIVLQASSGEDRLVHIWDLDLKREAEGVPEAKRARGTLPKELMLTHAGHRAPVGCDPNICG